MKSSLTLLTLSFSLTMVACSKGGGGPSAPANVSALAGTWAGQYVELDAPPIGSGGGARVELVVNDAGNVTTIRVNGQPNGSGRITATPGTPGIFGYVFSLGGEGGFYVDPTGRYAAAVDEDGTIAILQRDAVGLPDYDYDDIAGSWSGESVWVDQGLGYEDRVPSQVSVDANGQFNGTENGEAFAALDELDFYSNTSDPSLAFWFAEFSSLRTPVGVGRFILSPDKQFLAGFAGANGGLFPADFSFPVWQRQ